MLRSTPADTPMDSNIKLSTVEDNTPVDKVRYQRLVGKLIYLSYTQPDIGFAVSSASQFMNNPTEEHTEAVNRILRYFKMTLGKGLYFGKTTKRSEEIYTDADWAGSKIERKSNSGYCMLVWGNLVTWRSKKQHVVSISNMLCQEAVLR